MTRHIENEAAYESAIRRRMILNGIKGRLQRLQDEAPMIVRLIEEVITPRRRREHEAEQARQRRNTERAGGVWHEAGTAAELLDWEDSVAADFAPLFDLRPDRLDSTARWIFNLDWEYVELYTFPEQLVIRHLKTSKGLSPKQAEWVVKMVEEEPRREQAAQERREARQRADAASTHVGTVGERLRGVEAVVDFVRDLDGGMYGPKRLVKLRTAGGDVLVTFSTSEWVWSAERGQQVVLDFTVKAHDEYEGTAQTTITRAKTKEVGA
jgi:hypothetical protein